MRQAADGNQINTAGSDCADCVQRHASRGFGQQPALHHIHGCFQHFRRHIIQHNDIGTTVCQNLFQLRQRIDFDLDFNHMSGCAARRIQHGVNTARNGDVIVFDWQKNGWADHIGFVESVSGNQVTTIEGNISRVVARRVYTYNDWRVAGYALGAGTALMGEKAAHACTEAVESVILQVRGPRVLAAVLVVLSLVGRIRIPSADALVLLSDVDGLYDGPPSRPGARRIPEVHGPEDLEGIETVGQAYELVGHKWFCSAPMCDAFLTLAQTERGLSCFLLPRHRPDGSRNQFYIQRLKDKLGNQANASSEVEFRGALAWMVGDEGRGVPTIIEMVAMTRFDCMIGSSSLMRQALTQAMHHCQHRAVGGRALVDQPLMQNVLADLALESEAALALTMRMGKALDNAHDEQEVKYARLVTAIGKYWICKRAPAMINEAQECLGGAGYVEDTILPRLYREAPVNSIWEGSGNVQCLDVLRALSKEPGVLDVLFAELGDGRGDARLASHIQRLQRAFADKEDIQYRARQLTEEIAVALQARLLLDAGNSAVADAFIASRLNGGGRVYGTLPRGLDIAALLQRSMPQQA